MSSSHNIGKKLLALQISAIVFGAGASLTTHAQENTRFGANAALLEEVVVTARKREEGAQDTPIAISAYGSDQLEAMQVRDLTGLAVGMPNVALDDAGTTRGTANFSIRGLGVNSSIPSIDPTVGIFVDGVYMGVNNGVIFDTFDLESIEVLRGPQGILFGRNVTGGAILVNTKLPGQEFEAKVKGAVEGGGEELNKYFMASVSGPLADNLAAKLSVYTNRDDGWFKNEYDGDAFGRADNIMVRPVVSWDINEDVNLVLRYEYSEFDGDGPAGQNHTSGTGTSNPTANFDRDSHKFSIDEEGFLKSRTNMFSAELNWDVGFGDGTITNIFGWRDYTSTSLGDIDSSPLYIFHSDAALDAEQYSNELRYNGTFGDFTLTSGLYYFNNELAYYEGRKILGGTVTQDGGGDYSVESRGVFIAGDYAVNDNLTLSAGLRYTRETKEAEIASLTANTNLPCNTIDGTCPIDFEDDESWNSLSPKFGFSYALDNGANVYGYWARGYRSGGYNLRNTSIDPTVTPGPFDEESVDTFELGYKGDLGERGRFNIALFHTTVDDMQREVNTPSINGPVQVIQNTADATLQGIEFDTTFALSDTLILTAALGYTDASYDQVKVDLEGPKDSKDLDIPRAAEWTYSIALNHDLQLGDWGYAASRISYAYRDESAYTDSNYGYIDEQNIVDASVDFHSNDEHWIISLYGKNLLDEVKHGGDTQLDALGGGTFAPLSKGVVYGLGLTYTY